MIGLPRPWDEHPRIDKSLAFKLSITFGCLCRSSALHRKLSTIFLGPRTGAHRIDDISLAA